MRKYRYSFLLGALLLLLVTIALASAVRTHLPAQICVNIALVLLLVSGGFAASGSGSARRVIVGLAIATVAMRIWLEFFDNSALEAATYSAALSFLIAVALLTIRFLLTSERVTYDTLAASLCGYGVLAAAWAAAYSLLELLQPGAFSYSELEGLGRSMQFGLGESATALYFSLVTMTTLGYGDIVPATDTARLLASIEAFVGQAYIAVLVAKLVGQYIVTASGSIDED